MNVQRVVTGYVVKAYDAKATRANKTASPEAAKPTEKVHVSASADEVRSVRQFIDALPEVRIHLVEEIQERIRKNDYPIENRFEEAMKKMSAEKILQNL